MGIPYVPYVPVGSVRDGRPHRRPARSCTLTTCSCPSRRPNLAGSRNSCTHRLFHGRSGVRTVAEDHAHVVLSDAQERGLHALGDVLERESLAVRSSTDTRESVNTSRPGSPNKRSGMIAAILVLMVVCWLILGCWLDGASANMISVPRRFD